MNAASNLKGSEKQVAWAESVKEATLKTIPDAIYSFLYQTSYLATGGLEEDEKEALLQFLKERITKVLDSKQDAKWWIESAKPSKGKFVSIHQFPEVWSQFYPTKIVSIDRQNQQQDYNLSVQGNVISYVESGTQSKVPANALFQQLMDREFSVSY